MNAGAAPRGDALAKAGAIALLVYVVAITTSIAPMGIATALLGAVTLALVATKREAWPRTPVDLAAIGWAIAYLAAAWFAQDRAASLVRLHKLFFPLLVGVVVLRARRRAEAERALATWFAATALVAVFGIGAWVAHGASFEQRARGLSGHYMTFAGQLLLELPLAIAVAVCDRRPRWRLGAGAAALLAVAALGVTFTRSAWIGLVVELAVIAGAVFPLSLVGLALAAAAAYFFAPGAWRERLHSMFDPTHPWNAQRVFMWKAGLRMFHDHPLTGVGLQDLRPLYERYRDPAATEKAGHLHNVFVQIAASMGSLGLAAFAWLYGSFVYCATQGLGAMRRRGGFAFGVRLGVVAALAGFLVAGFFEWNFGDEELLYTLYALVGLAWAARGWEEA